MDNLIPLSPSGIIPTELLSEIFLHCADGGMDEINTIEIPLLVSRICGRWRETALATPRLWSRLFLQLKQPYCDAADSQINLVRTWLTRSGGCQLTVYVFWEEPPFLANHPVLDALMEHSERWNVMFFYMPYAAFKSFSRIRKRIPALTELSLGTRDDPSSGFIGTLDAFTDAPKLISLECVKFSPLIFKFPWSQLRSIPMMVVSIDDCLEILHETTRLEKGGFTFIGSVKWFPLAPSIRLQHNHIRQFTIMTPPWNETVDLRRLFPQLTFPLLEELTICNLKSPFCTEFVLFLSRLRSLRTLHLRKTALTDYQLVQGLEHLPSLTELIVYSAPQRAPTVTYLLLSALTWRTFAGDEVEGQMLVPALKKLELTIDYNVSEAFIDMVSSRVLINDQDKHTIHPARLEQIRIRPTEDLGDGIYTELAQLASQGVEISVEDLAEMGSYDRSVDSSSDDL